MTVGHAHQRGDTTGLDPWSFTVNKGTCGHLDPGLRRDDRNLKFGFASLRLLSFPDTKITEDDIEKVFDIRLSCNSANRTNGKADIFGDHIR